MFSSKNVIRVKLQTKWTINHSKNYLKPSLNHTGKTRLGLYFAFEVLARDLLDQLNLCFVYIVVFKIANGPMDCILPQEPMEEIKEVPVPKEEASLPEQEEQDTGLPWKRGGDEVAQPAAPGAEVPGFDTVRDGGQWGEAPPTDEEGRRGGVLFMIGDEDGEEVRQEVAPIAPAPFAGVR